MHYAWCIMNYELIKRGDVYDAVGPIAYAKAPGSNS